jgi:hypothetical protein
MHWLTTEIPNSDLQLTWAFRHFVVCGLLPKSSHNGKLVAPAEWVGPPGTRHAKLHDYEDSPEDAPQIEFTESIKWSLQFVIERPNSVRLSVPELRIRAEVSSPGDLNQQSDPINDQSQPVDHIVLEASVGIPDAVLIQRSTIQDVRSKFGDPAATYDLAGGKKNIEFAQGFVIHVDRSDVVQTIMTTADSPLRARFQQQMVQLGNQRDEILAKLGQPLNATERDAVYVYRGLSIWFTGDEVTKIVVH